MKIDFVTSFSQSGYELYAKKFLEDFIRHFPSSYTLHVFHEEQLPKISHPKIRYYELYKEPGFKEFLGRHAADDTKKGIFTDKDGKQFVNYRHQAWKFCRKV